MKLRTKITIGMVILIFLSLGLSCGIMIYKIVKMQEQEAYAYTLGEQKNLLRQFSFYQPSDMSEQAGQTFYQYSFSQVARTAGEDSEFVLQSETADIYNNSGMDVKTVLERYGDEVEEVYGYGWPFVQTIIHWQGGYYCIVGSEKEINGETYHISVVRNITDSIRQVKKLGFYCALIGAGVMLLAMLGVYFYLKWELNPLKELQSEANTIVKKYATDNEAKEKGQKEENEIVALDQSFHQMQDTVEDYIARLEKKSEEQKMLLAALAHEMKTPVTAITGYAYALKHARLTEEQRKEAVSFVDEESRRLERLSVRLTELISLEHEATLAREEIVLEEWGRQLGRILEQKAETLEAESKLQWEIEVEPESDADAASTGRLTGDRDLLTVLVTNLFDNARKAGATKITVALSENSIRVTDNGCGIPKEEMEKVTQPFYQGDASRKQEGFGLGLALCKKIADVHGGRLCIESEEGKGSSFIFYNFFTTL